ncbi:LysR family transcriptional regulator [Chelatococcus sp. SYSU_G07232]|uniref:LysR family transcriptional regulator n=1 Tax=Chelatococcus albus TaxID=3047466 RepID=A0ABT7AFC1_9HYPH|nr:LysR family transcriptional regulator [Chelatococcus sp. SYSU_G07232]MDJ1158070.1 LysR family transcriptional regulator [Chelatococcus sp. SYSU_G07232]
MVTLRQIEIIRAILVTGTIAGAARLLNISAPGVSRLLKYTDQSLGFRLFERRHGRYLPAPRAAHIFEQINNVYKDVEDLRYLIERVDIGTGQELKIGSAPSISMVMVPRAIVRLRRRHPDLVIDLNILKMEETLDYLLLGKGELVAMSHSIAHPNIASRELAHGRLFCIVPEGHALASRTEVTPREIASHPLIGIDPADPYGRIMADIFRRSGISFEITIRARFGSTVCTLVRAGLGIAVIDQFTLAYGSQPGITALEISEKTEFKTFLMTRNDVTLSVYAEHFVKLLSEEMRGVANAPRAAATRGSAVARP